MTIGGPGSKKRPSWAADRVGKTGGNHAPGNRNDNRARSHRRRASLRKPNKSVLLSDNADGGDLLYDTTTPPITTVAQVGQGTYGKVYKAIDVKTKRILAMKRLRLDGQGDWVFPISAAREIKLLQLLNHPNIIELIEIVVCGPDIYMAFDYVQNDLAGLMLNRKLVFTLGNVKSIIKQLLFALRYLHENGVIHRDIKGSNILITGEGAVKLADFGLARQVNPREKSARYTNRVITLWYRPPELLLGSEHYSYEVDMWGVGCLLVELILRKAPFCGKDDISQLFSIYSVLGVPSREDWPQYAELPWFPLIDALPTQPVMLRASSEKAPSQSPRAPASTPGTGSREGNRASGAPNVFFRPGSWTYRFDTLFKSDDVSPACFDLASAMLQMNPAKRVSAEQALKHDFFVENPLSENMTLGESLEWHDWEAKQRMRKRESDVPEA